MLQACLYALVRVFCQCLFSVHDPAVAWNLISGFLCVHANLLLSGQEMTSDFKGRGNVLIFTSFFFLPATFSVIQPC